MFALIDCNNFYASCERLFNPALIGKPVIVLSNNDGCVIARSNEAKELGIKMGDVPFEIEDVIQKHNVAMFSSNYTLYGDMSQRVMNTLANFSPDIEIYSIDEAFLQFNGFEYYNFTDYAKEIRSTVIRCTGIPVCVGMATTKTLAKIANRFAKKNLECTGTFVIDTEDKRLTALRQTEIADVWGVGYRYAALLRSKGVNTAYDFTLLPSEWVLKEMTIVGYRTQKELLGLPCIELEQFPPKKQNICTSRSFGKMQIDYSDIAEAAANYAASCAEKLRKENSCANLLTVFLNTNRFRMDLKQFNPSVTVQLPTATNSSMLIVEYALKGLTRIFRKGYQYKKVGILVSGLVPESVSQMSFFNTLDTVKQGKALKALDAVNKRYGRNTLHIAATEGKRAFALRCERKTPNYTTNWNDIIKVIV